MSSEQFFQLIMNIQIWQIAKVLVCFVLLFYTVFAFVIVRQVNLMTDTVKLSLEWLIKTIAFAHLVGAIFVLLIAILIL
jgi:hypothetical protein